MLGLGDTMGNKTDRTALEEFAVQTGWQRSKQLMTIQCDQDRRGQVEGTQGARKGGTHPTYVSSGKASWTKQYLSRKLCRKQKLPR